MTVSQSSKSPSVVALIVAAGRGTRAAVADRSPKQFVRLGHRSVLQCAIDAFVSSGRVHRIAVVIHPDDGALYQSAVVACPELLPPICGGATRQQSVRLGLEALAQSGPGLVLIHDAARPFVDSEIIGRVIDGVGRGRGAIAAIEVSDTLKRAGSDGTIAATIKRDGLWRAQTPQGFLFDEILEAHRSAADAGEIAFTDDAALAEWAGMQVRVVQGADRNVKLTTAEDIAMAKGHAATSAGVAFGYETRTGTGFDVHRFARGDGVWSAASSCHTSRVWRGIRMPMWHCMR